MADTDELLTTREAAQFLKMNEQTVRIYARRGTMPALRVGKRWLIRRSALDAWLDSHQPVQRGATVLIVDDDEVILDSVGQMLEEEGFAVQTARDGVEALDSIVERMPDVVLLDLKMAGMDGATTLKAIRMRWEGLPVIILTGYPDSDLMHDALQFSPITILAKPSDPEKALRAVNDAVGMRKSVKRGA